jgi:hypothetical protein
VYRSEEMIEGIEAAGGERAKLTIYPNKAEHNAQPEVFGSPDLFEWFLAHSLETP